jgi:hypothetical protein
MRGCQKLLAVLLVNAQTEEGERMMAAYVISSVGLGLDIIGVLLIWKYGFAADLARPSGPPVSVPQSYKTDPKVIPLSTVALVCLVIGFGLQLAGNMMQMASLP